MKKTILLPLCVMILCLVLAVGALIFAYPVFQRRNTRLVIWQAPASMRKATEEDMLTGSELRRPTELVLSSQVSVTANGQSLPVYETNVSHDHVDSLATPNQSRTPVVNFDFSGEVTIKVDMGELDVEEVEVQPAAAEIEPVIEAGQVSITLTEPGNYTLIFNRSEKRALHIFTSAPEDERVYQKGGEDVLYYGPGEYDVGTLTLTSNQILYLSGGAVIHGNILCDHAEHVRILGRGIIDGSLYGGDANNRNVKIPINLSCSSDIEVRGLLLLNPNGWVLQGYCSQKADIGDVRIISSRANGDGVTLQSCVDFKVHDMFVRSWDDSLVVKNYQESSHDITFENCQIWTDLAQSMEVGYETNKGSIENPTMKNITFSDITVLRNNHKPIMSIHNADNCLISGVTFRNIVVEHADMQASAALMEFEIVESSWGTTVDRGFIENVTVENVNVLETKYNRMKANISGFGNDYTVRNINVKNVTIMGEKITDVMGKLEFDIGKNVSGLYIQ